MPEVEPFDAFLARTAAARPEDFAEALRAAGGPEGPAAAEEFGRMKAYVLDYYRGVRPARSFLDAAGRPVDCVPFEQQPTVRAAREAGLTLPALPPPSGAPAGPCPAGAVPLVRVTLERMVQSGTFENYFRKKPFPSPPAGGP